jgi:hypothetical protein
MVQDEESGALSSSAAGQDCLGDDLIWGVDRIAKELRKTPRQVFHLVETKQIPVGKVGGRVVASRAVLRRFFANILNGEVA